MILANRVAVIFELRQVVGRRATGVVMASVFVLGFASIFGHVDLETHTYCREHQQVTHVDREAEAGTTHESEKGGEYASQHASDMGDGEPGQPGEHEPEGCEWLDWMHSNTSPLAQLQPYVFVLPPPVEAQVGAISDEHQFADHPIDRQHISPINSPPTG